MTSTTLCGCDTIDTCEASTSVMRAPAFLASARCAFGGMIRSCLPMIAHAGMSVQAGGPDGAKADAALAASASAIGG